MKRLFVFGLPYTGSRNICRILSSIPNVNVRNNVKGVDDNMNMGDIKYFVSSSIIDGYRYSGYRISIDHFCECKKDFCNTLYVKHMCDLINNEDTKVVVVDRDEFEQYVSFLIFKNLKIRNVKSGSDEHHKCLDFKLRILLNQFLKYKENKKVLMDKFNDMVGSKNRLDIHYDDINDDFQGYFNREVFPFLGIPRCKVKPCFANTVPDLESVVENYKYIVKKLQEADADIH
jgi:hypothetical protein